MEWSIWRGLISNRLKGSVYSLVDSQEHAGTSLGFMIIK